MVLTAAAALASPCLADVIEIGGDGAAVTYRRPAVFTDAGVNMIGAPAVSSAPRTTVVDIRQVITEAAERHRLNPDLVTEVAWRKPDSRQAAVSNRDAVGVMQLTAGTARDLGVDRYDVRQNIHGGAAYLRSMLDRYGGDLRLALAAYNAGPGAVDRYRGVPPYAETNAYVTSILSRLSQRALLSASPIIIAGQ